jgi:hypothetical protein
MSQTVAVACNNECGQIALLVILTQPELDVEAVRRICSDNGFQESAPDAPDVGYLLMNSAQRGLFKLTDRFIAFRKHLTDDGTTVMEATPPEVEAVLAQLRSVVEPLRSLSLNYDPEENSCSGVSGKA